MEKNMIHSKMVEIMRKASSIGKDRKNVSQKYSFRGIDDIYNSLHDIMAEVGVFMTTNVKDVRGEERTTKSGTHMIYRIASIEFTFHAEDGSSVSSTVVGEGADTGDKASNKAMSVAHKYALLQAFLIPTEESKDPEDESPVFNPQEFDAKTATADELTNAIKALIKKLPPGSEERKSRINDVVQAGTDAVTLRIIYTNMIMEAENAQ
jgi:hypothetical protein